MFAFLGGAANPLRMRVVDRQRLLHHHVDTPRGGRLDDRRVIQRVRERGDGLGLRALEHRFEIGEDARSRGP